MYGAPPPPPPSYAMLNGGNPYPNGPYYYPNAAPQYYPNPYRKRSGGGAVGCCCRCICCFCCFFLILLLIQLLTIFYFFHAYNPKVPSYDVERINIKAFDMKPDSSFNADFQVTINAVNPNKNIGLIYGNDSVVSVEYSDVNFGSGKLPAFRQGHLNTTVFEVDLRGNSTVGPKIQQDFIKSQKNQRIPLMVKMKVPINLVVGDFILREFKVFVNCSIVLDSLSSNKTSQIVSRLTTFAIDI